MGAPSDEYADPAGVELRTTISSSFKDDIEIEVESAFGSSKQSI